MKFLRFISLLITISPLPLSGYPMKSPPSSESEPSPPSSPKSKPSPSPKVSFDPKIIFWGKPSQVPLKTIETFKEIQKGLSSGNTQMKVLKPTKTKKQFEKVEGKKGELIVLESSAQRLSEENTKRKSWGGWSMPREEWFDVKETGNSPKSPVYGGMLQDKKKKEDNKETLSYRFPSMEIEKNTRELPKKDEEEKNQGSQSAFPFPSTVTLQRKAALFSQHRGQNHTAGTDEGGEKTSEEKTKDKKWRHSAPAKEMQKLELGSWVNPNKEKWVTERKENLEFEHEAKESHGNERRKKEEQKREPKKEE